MKHVIFYLLLLVSVSACDKKGKDTIYLVPEGFHGRAVIFFDVENGDPEAAENGSVVLRLKENGCLLTRSQPNFGIFKQTFYFCDSLGKRTCIPEDVEFTSDTLPSIYGEVTSSVDHNGKKVCIFSFLVCTKKEYPELNRTDIDTSCLDK
ncbi:MAG TPA: hypothetical protein VFU15_16110 [Bacteroidia bacterium]|nr:hypothetical protein [Bacteroidia bacterium]